MTLETCSRVLKGSLPCGLLYIWFLYFIVAVYPLHLWAYLWNTRCLSWTVVAYAQLPWKMPPVWINIFHFIFSNLFVMLVHFLHRMMLVKLLLFSQICMECWYISCRGWSLSNCFYFLKFAWNVDTFLVEDDPFQTVFIFSVFFVILVHFL